MDDPTDQPLLCSLTLRQLQDAGKLPFLWCHCANDVEQSRVYAVRHHKAKVQTAVALNGVHLQNAVQNNLCSVPCTRDAANNACLSPTDLALLCCS